MKKPFWVMLILLGIIVSGCTDLIECDQQPNIMLIVADDLGYGDIGSYGGDIKTPHIDALAEGGVKFSSFHTAPHVCAY